MNVKPDQLERLLALEHSAPHSILGAHPPAAGVVVRAYRPGAASLVVLPDDGEPRSMEKTHPTGLFEARFPELAVDLRRGHVGARPPRLREEQLHRSRRILGADLESAVARRIPPDRRAEAEKLAQELAR